MSSNIKPKTPSKEAPNEPFKRAVTGCLRAIARHPELEVGFAAERPGLVGGKARLPEPPRRLTKGEAAIVRGHADSIALRMACHDAARAPQADPRRPAGARRVRGGRAGPRRGDRRAPHDRRRRQSRRHARRQVPPRQVRRHHRPRRRADRGGGGDDGARAPDRPGAAGRAAKKLVDLWRPWIEERAGRELDRLGNVLEDQRRFGDAVHDLLDSLEMGDERSRDDEDEERRTADDQEGQQGRPGRGRRSLRTPTTRSA